MAGLTSDDLADEAVHNGVRVLSADLGRRWGHYDNEARAITLNICMTEAQRRSTLAHELDHAWHGDGRTWDKAEYLRRERRADIAAARKLISPVEYALAERLVGHDPRALAEELDVAPWVIEAFQREAAAGRGWTRGVASVR